MTVPEAIVKIEELLSTLAKELDNADYEEALSELCDRATNAYNARMEELGKGEEDA